MADVKPEPAGDVTQRVGVEVIKARVVDVDKLIKMLITNAAAEFAMPLLLLHNSADAPGWLRRLQRDLRRCTTGRQGALGADCSAHLRAWRGITERIAHLS